MNNIRPKQYIDGDVDFMGTILKVDERVLIPRPETEIMVDYTIDQFKHLSQKNLKILDLGTGSGNIAITLAKHLKNAHITTVDKSQQALDLALINALDHNVTDQIDFICTNMIDYLKTIDTKFDLIISNPPYIPTNYLPSLPLDVQCEPQLALDGGDDGLFYIFEILNQGQKLLNDEGVIAIEIWDGQSKAIEQYLIKNTKLNQHQFIKDYTQVDRILWTSLSLKADSL